jgi:hypothetical protein
MDVGLMIRYGKLVTGREHQAMDLFQDTLAYFGQKLERGEIPYFEPFFLMTTDQEEELGFFIVKGDMAALTTIVNDEGFKVLMEKARVLASHVQMDWLQTGDSIGEQVELSLKVLSELGV